MLRNIYYGPRASVIKGQYAGGVAVRGITRPLKEVFYPHHRVVRRKRGNSSASIGTRVHKEIEDLTNGLEVKRKHRYTLAIEHYLAKHELCPVASEAPLLSFKGRYLTHVDLICTYIRPIDKVKELVVVSLKTGYNDGVKNSRNFCRGVCKTLPNSFATHHALQLACEVYTMRYEYHIPVSRAIILYVGFGRKKKTAVSKLPTWANDKPFMDSVHRALKRTDPRPELWPVLRRKMDAYVAPEVEIDSADEEDLLGTDIFAHDQHEAPPASPPFVAPDEYIGDVPDIVAMPDTSIARARQLPSAIFATKRVYVARDKLSRNIFEVYDTPTHYAVCSNTVQRLTWLEKALPRAETMTDFAALVPGKQPNATHYAFYWELLHGDITRAVDVIDLEPTRQTLTKA